MSLKDLRAPFSLVAALGLLAAAVPAGTAWPAATVTLRDGTMIVGDAEFDADAMLVRTPDRAHRLELKDVLLAEFVPADGPAAAPRQPAGPRPTPEPPSGGLRGEYYADREMRELRLVRVDERIDFNWPPDHSPDPLVPAVFAARWTGDIEPAASDMYTFHVEAYSGVRLWIDGQLIIDRWGFAPGVFTGTARLRAACRHGIRLEYHNTQYGGHVRLYWSSRQQDYELIGPQRLSPPVGTLPPPVRILRPADDELILPSGVVAVEVKAGNRDGQIAAVRLFADGALVATLKEPPWRFQWRDPATGHHRLQASATDTAGVTALSRPAHVVVAERTGLQPPWVAAPVGSSPPVGRTVCQPGQITLRTSGGGMGDGGDALHFVMRPISGDGTLTVRLRDFDGGADAAAGLMLRESLRQADSRCAFLGMAGGGIVFSRREARGEGCKSGEYDGYAPVWLRLQRHGDIVRAWRSQDGRKWELLAARTLAGDSAMYAGLAAWGEAAAVFDNPEFAPGAPALVGGRGALLRTGSFMAGEVHSADDTCVRIGPAGRTAIPRRHVARLLLAPLAADSAAILDAGRTGVLLRNGDFIDGEVGAIGDGRLAVDSVLFGARRLSLDEVNAVVLRDMSPGPHAAEVHLADGSVLRPRTVDIRGGRLMVEDGTGVRMALRAAELTRLAIAR